MNTIIGTAAGTVLATYLPFDNHTNIALGKIRVYRNLFLLKIGHRFDIFYMRTYCHNIGI